MTGGPGTQLGTKAAAPTATSASASATEPARGTTTPGGVLKPAVETTAPSPIPPGVLSTETPLQPLPPAPNDPDDPDTSTGSNGGGGGATVLAAIVAAVGVLLVCVAAVVAKKFCLKRGSVVLQRRHARPVAAGSRGRIFLLCSMLVVFPRPPLKFGVAIIRRLC